MNKKINILTILFLLLSISNIACADCNLTPYIGVDAQLRHTHFKRNFGNNLFRHNYPQGNIYAGLRWNDFFAFELGYEATKKEIKTKTLFVGDFNLGTPIVVGTAPTRIVSQSRMNGVHLNLVGFYPLCPENEVELLGGIGLVYLRAHFKQTIFQIAGAPVLQEFRYHGNKAVARAFLGIQQMITDCIGVRGMIAWENTNRFKPVTNTLLPLTGVREIRLRDSMIYSLGFFGRF